MMRWLCSAYILLISLPYAAYVRQEHLGADKRRPLGGGFLEFSLIFPRLDAYKSQYVHNKDTGEKLYGDSWPLNCSPAIPNAGHVCRRFACAGECFFVEATGKRDIT